MKKYIAIDLGSSNGRIIVGDLKSIEVVYRFPNTIIQVRDSHFWDILYIYREIKTGLAKAFSMYPGNIVSIGIDTCALDYGILDEQGDLIGNLYNYRDKRTNKVPEMLFKEISKREIFDETGIQFMAINTLYQLYAHKISKPYVFAGAEAILSTAALILFWLTGEKANEFSYATTMQLYNPTISDWSDKLLNILSLKKEQFGEIVSPGTILGPLLPEIADEIGADRDILVIAPVTHDTGSAVASVPATSSDKFAYISSGTWSLLGIEAEKPIINDKSFQCNFSNEGGTNGGFRFLKNIIGLWMIQECKRQWDSSGRPISYGELCRTAEDYSAEFTLDVSDPRFIPSGIPGDTMIDRVRCHCEENGYRYVNKPGFLVRVILEGLASLYHDTINDIEYITEDKIKTLHIVGGGCQNGLLCQLSANATGIPVIAGPIEATAIGNILVQSLALDEISSVGEGREAVRNNFEINEYTPQ